MRTTSCLVVIFVATCACRPVRPAAVPIGPAGQTLDALNDPESYAVYSAVLAPMVGVGREALTSFVVMDHTVPRRACSVAPKGEFGTDLPALFTMYVDANSRTYSLVPALFKAAVPYTFSPDVPSGATRLAPRSKWLALSAVGFDATRTWALLSVVNETNGVMSEDGYVTLMHKDDAGHWANVSLMCLWIE